MPPLSLPIPAKWKARFKSTLMDVDSALISNATLRSHLLGGDIAKAEKWIATHKPEEYLIQDWEKLISAAKSGGVVTAITRGNDVIAQALAQAIGAQYKSPGFSGDFGSVAKSLDGPAGTQGNHVVITGLASGVTAAAHSAKQQRSSLSVIFGQWHPDGWTGTQAEKDEAWKNRWAILACPATITAARRQVAINTLREPIFKGFTDHATAYPNDYAYQSLKELGISKYGTPTGTVLSLKNYSEARSEKSALAAARTLLGTWLDGRFQTRESPFIIIPVVGSTPIAAGETQDHYRSSQAGWYVAEAITEAANGNAEARLLIQRITKPDKNSKKKNKGEDFVQVHIESLDLLPGSADIIKDKDILLVDDIVTEGTQFETCESLLRILGEPRSVTRLALTRTLKGNRLTQAGLLLSEPSTRVEVSRRALIAPYEDYPLTYNYPRFDLRKLASEF